jgi:hypothetical protein
MQLLNLATENTESTENAGEVKHLGGVARTFDSAGASPLFLGVLGG